MEENGTSAVTVVEPKSPAQTEVAAIIAMVERASRDDSVNIDKMRELLAMRKEIIAQAAEHSFNDAMARAQAEMEPIRADAHNKQTSSKYASYYALDKAVRPIYTKQGFALSFNTEPGAPTGEIRFVCYVTCAGHTRKYQADMPADGKGAKGGDVMTRTHATGSAMTYGQRYLLKAIFNIAVGGEDDDGNAASGGNITEDQAEALLALIEKVGADIKKFCDAFKIDGVALLPAKRFEEAKVRLNKFANQQKAAG